VRAVQPLNSHSFSGTVFPTANAYFGSGAI
jgi:hypothetical protein